MDDRSRKAFEYLRARNGEVVSIDEIATASGWSPVTVRTYASKHWRPWLRSVAPGEFRVQSFDEVSYSSFLSRQSQVKADPSTPKELSDRIETALRTKESQDAEFKASLPPKSYDLAHEIAAFATSNSGLILVGVDNDGEVVGLGSGTGAGHAIVRELIESAADKVRPRIGVAITFVNWSGRTIAAIEVTKGPEPLYYVDGKPYVRSGTRARPADPDEVKRLFEDALNSQALDTVDLRTALRRIAERPSD